MPQLITLLQINYYFFLVFSLIYNIKEGTTYLHIYCHEKNICLLSDNLVVCIFVTLKCVRSSKEFWYYTQYLSIYGPREAKLICCRPWVNDISVWIPVTCFFVCNIYDLSQCNRTMDKLKCAIFHSYL